VASVATNAPLWRCILFGSQSTFELPPGCYVADRPLHSPPSIFGKSRPPFNYFLSIWQYHWYVFHYSPFPMRVNTRHLVCHPGLSMSNHILVPVKIGRIVTSTGTQHTIRILPPTTTRPVLHVLEPLSGPMCLAT